MTKAYFENTSCPLWSRKDWVTVLEREASQKSGIERESIEFILKSSQVLDLLVDCRKLILQEDVRLGDVGTRHHQLLRKSKGSRDNFLAWYRARLPSLSQYSQRVKENMSPQKQDLMWLGQFLTLVHNRLHVALGGDLTARVEEESQSLAVELSGFVKGRKDKPEFRWPIALTFAVASVLSTANEWSEFVGDCTKTHTATNRNLVSAEFYMRWLQELGITVT